MVFSSEHHGTAPVGMGHERIRKARKALARLAASCAAIQPRLSAAVTLLLCAAAAVLLLDCLLVRDWYRDPFAYRALGLLAVSAANAPVESVGFLMRGAQPVLLDEPAAVQGLALAIGVVVAVNGSAAFFVDCVVRATALLHNWERRRARQRLGIGGRPG